MENGKWKMENGKWSVLAVMERWWCSLQGKSPQMFSELQMFKFNISWLRRACGLCCRQVTPGRFSIVSPAVRQEGHGTGNVQLREGKAKHTLDILS